MSRDKSGFELVGEDLLQNSFGSLAGSIAGLIIGLFGIPEKGFAGSEYQREFTTAQLHLKLDYKVCASFSIT
jgi:hypothetical protein